VTSLSWGAVTHKGAVRDLNQDRFVAAANLFAVADGMGGHQGGEIAAELAVDTFTAADRPTTLDELIEMVEDANAEIVLRATGEPELRGMGTTACLLAVLSDDDGRLGIANVGDSRLYRLTDDGLHQHTEDHSLVAALMRDGRLTAEEAKTHPQRNIVTRALGIDNRVLVDAWELTAVAGDRYLICSDGLFNEVAADAIVHTLRSVTDPQVAAEDLVEQACEAGGRDNITVIVVDVEEAPKSKPPKDRVLDQVLGLRAVAAESLFDSVRAAQGEESSEPAVVVKPSTLTWRTFAMFFVVFAIFLVVAVVMVQAGRSGFGVVEGDDGTVAIVRGEDFLWFEPELDTTSSIVVDELPELERDRVEEGQAFNTRAEAETFLEYLESLAEPDE